MGVLGFRGVRVGFGLGASDPETSARSSYAGSKGFRTVLAVLRLQFRVEGAFRKRCIDTFVTVDVASIGLKGAVARGPGDIRK